MIGPTTPTGQTPVAPSNDALLAEYRACLDQIQVTGGRQWQVAAGTAAVYTAAFYLLFNLTNSDAYAIWVKLSAVWIALVLLTMLNLVFYTASLSEIFWQQVAYRRMMDLEDILGLRLMMRGYVLIKRPWLANRSPGDWRSMAPPERDAIRSDFDQGVYGLVPTRYRPEFVRPFIAVIAIAQLGLVTAAVVETVYLATK
jgi:hypothetical protein